MTKPVVFLADALEFLGPYDYERATLAAHGIELREGHCQTAEDVVAQGQGAEMLWTLAAPISRAALAALPDGRIALRWGVGYDIIDAVAATELGVAVANCPTYCTEEVATHASALILDAARKVSRADRAIRAGCWPYADFKPIQRLSMSTLGFVGFGRIARMTARQMTGFGVRMIAHDPFLPDGTLRAHGVEPVDLPTLLAGSDYVSVHVPLSPDTRHLIGAAELRQMRPSAYLINTSRGSIIDEVALARALQEGWIAGAALDVFETEPLDLTSPLRGMDAVTLTPHMGAYSEQALPALRREACETAIRWFADGWAPNVVNPQVRERLRPRRANAD